MRNGPRKRSPMFQYFANLLIIKINKSSWMLGERGSPPMLETFRRCRANRSMIAAGPVMIQTIGGGQKPMKSGDQDCSSC